MPLSAMPFQALRAGLDYLRRHPTELLHAARHAAGFRAAIPMDALRWLVERAAKGKRAPKDVVLGTRPPAITVGATVDLMGNPVRVATAIRVEELRLGPDELRVTLRLSDFQIDALDPQSPAAQLFKALDKTKPANLANFMPKRPAAVVEARDDLIVLDLMKEAKIAGNQRLRRLLGVITPVLVMREIRSEDEHIVLQWRPRVMGVTEAIAAFRG